MPVVSDINADKYQSAGRHQTIRRQTSENSILERKRDNPAAFGGIQNLSPVRAIPQLSGQKGPSNLRTLRPKGRSNLRTFLHNPSTQPAASAASLCAQRAEKTSEPGREAAFDKGAIKIGVSDSVSDSVKRISPKNVRTVYNAMDFARLDVTGEESCISEKTGVIRCMIMGNHFERKGVDMAAKAVQMLTMGGVKAELYIVADSYFNQQIESFLNQHVGKGWQSFAKIIPTRNDIGTYYKKMDFFLSPSREEGWTWAIEEAAYCGCQVVVSCIPGQDENKVPGFYWVGNPNHKDISTEIADVIKKVYKLPEKDKKESMKKANTYMKMQFSMDKWVENLLAVYDESIKE